MNQDQIESIVRTALKIIGALLIKHGLSDYAAIVNTPDVCGAVALLIGLWLSHQHHGDKAVVMDWLASHAVNLPPIAGLVLPAANLPPGTSKPAPGTASAPAQPPVAPVAEVAPATANFAPRPDLVPPQVTISPEPEISINQGGGRPASETRSPEPTAAPAPPHNLDLPMACDGTQHPIGTIVFPAGDKLSPPRAALQTTTLIPPANT